MSRTERLEAALREVLRAAEGFAAAVRQDSGIAYPWESWDCAAKAALTALADTAPSCCEETRRATLTEAIAATCPSCREGVPFRNNVRPGVLAYQHFQQTTVQDGEPRGLVNECHAMTLRALSNQVPPKSQAESGAPKSVVVPVLPVDDAAEYEKLLADKRTPKPKYPPHALNCSIRLPLADGQQRNCDCGAAMANPTPLPPVCPTCGGSRWRVPPGTTRPGIECPDCAGCEK